MYAASLHNLTN